MDTSLLQFLSGIIFLSILFQHLTKKNFSAVIAYGIQSLAIAIMLFDSFLKTNDNSLLCIFLIVLIVKVILAPTFFIKLIQKHKLTFSASTVLNVSLTLICLGTLTAVAHSQKFLPLTNIVPEYHSFLSLSFAAIFISLFLIINRKGALSQTLGILSLENCIVAFSIFAGLEQFPALQIGIIVNIAIWILIATIFISMIYKHFGTLDITSIKSLKD
ncbi:MAG: hypothetical protein AAB526_01645 [Patescibacteria group bacterium]